MPKRTSVLAAKEGLDAYFGKKVILGIAVGLFALGNLIWTVNNVDTTALGASITAVQASIAALLIDQTALQTSIAALTTAIGSVNTAMALLAPLASPPLTGTPTAPTAAVGTNTTQLATTAFVEAAVTAGTSTTLVQGGSFSCTNGIVSVTFPTPFPNTCTAVSIQWYYPSPDSGWVVPGSVTKTGFQVQNGNAGTCLYVAVGS